MNAQTDVSIAAFPREDSRFYSEPAVILKRIVDLTLCIIALPLFVLFMIPVLIAAASDGSSPFYSQMRVGRHGRMFRCYKFRTMTADAEKKLEALLSRDEGARAEWQATRKLKRDPRVTKFGQFLRMTSLDELPQIFNVLKGEMSFVGPRPVTSAEISMYGDRAGHYLVCLPGITGLWQVSGRNDVCYRTRVQCDSEYAERWNFWLDLKILALTVPVVLARKGAY